MLSRAKSSIYTTLRNIFWGDPVSGLSRKMGAECKKSYIPNSMKNTDTKVSNTICIQEHTTGKYMPLDVKANLPNGAFFLTLALCCAHFLRIRTYLEHGR